MYLIFFVFYLWCQMKLFYLSEPRTLYPPTQIMSEGKPVTPMDVETTEAPSEGGKCGCLPCKHAPKGKSHSEFMEYHDRRCTNLLCLLIYVAFMIAWAVVGSLAFKYGTPDM